MLAHRTTLLLITLNAAALWGQPLGAQTPAGHMPGMEEHKPAAQAAGPLRISFGDKSASWTADQLAALPHTTVQVYNAHVKANQTYAGVPLIDLLAQAGAPAKPEGKDLRLYLVAEGSDGYKVVYSLGEVAPNTHDATVIVADQMDGKGLGANGLFELVDTRDVRPARWVRNLVAI